jgi:hypothetical protein
VNAAFAAWQSYSSVGSASLRCAVWHCSSSQRAPCHASASKLHQVANRSRSERRSIGRRASRQPRAPLKVPSRPRAAPLNGRVAQVVRAFEGRARLSERAVGDGPDSHVLDHFSPTRSRLERERDAPYHRTTWATRPNVGARAAHGRHRAPGVFCFSSWFPGSDSKGSIGSSTDSASVMSGVADFCAWPMMNP